MDKREFSPEEITKAMCLCYGNNWDVSDVDRCERCPYDKFPLNCTQRLLSDAVSLLVEKFGGGDADGD